MRLFYSRFTLFSLILTLSALAGAASPFPDPIADIPSASGKQTAVLAGGCFWGVQAVFQHVEGVISATSGYAGGSAITAKYPVVSSGATNHAESVRVIYDPAKVSYGQLLKIFFSVAHDPTQLDRQGPDRGPQYRSAIFYENDAQRRVAQDYVDQLERAKTYPQPIVTRLAPLQAFYPAEAYHQDYMRRHPDDPYIVINDRPKVEMLKARFPSLYREPPK